METRDPKAAGNLKKRKVDMLNRIIFPSMANLIYFLEQVGKDERLRRAFDGDIEELLGLQYDEEEHKSKGYQSALERLITAMLKWDYDKKDERANFRLKALGLMQSVLSNELDNVATFQLGQDASTNLVTQDVIRASAWAQLLARQYKGYSGPPHRPIQF